MNTGRLRDKRYWIFDMDGTLTVAQHDFDAIRRELDLPPGKPILETLDHLPGPVALEKLERLEQIELRLAEQARPQAGAEKLLTSSVVCARATAHNILQRAPQQPAFVIINRCLSC